MMEEGKDMKPVTCEEKSIRGSERDGKAEYTEGRSQKQVGWKNIHYCFEHLGNSANRHFFFSDLSLSL